MLCCNLVSSGKNSLEAIWDFQLSYSLVYRKTITNSNQSLSMYSIQTVWKYILDSQLRNALHFNSTIAFRIENFHLNSNTFTRSEWIALFNKPILPILYILTPNFVLWKDCKSTLVDKKIFNSLRWIFW